MNILSAFLCFVGLGVLFGVLLAIASKVFHVESDPRVEQIPVQTAADAAMQAAATLPKG